MLSSGSNKITFVSITIMPTSDSHQHQAYRFPSINFDIAHYHYVVAMRWIVPDILVKTDPISVLVFRCDVSSI